MKNVSENNRGPLIVVISPYPPDAGWLDGLKSSAAGNYEVLLIKDLRRLPMKKTIRELRAKKITRLILYLPSPETRPLLPVMKVFAHLLAAKKVECVMMGRSPEPVTRRDAFWAGLGAVLSLINGYWRWFRLDRELKTLLKSPRLNLKVTKDKPSSVLYIKANPMGQGAVGGAVAHTAGVVNGFSKAGCRVTYLSMEPPVDVDADVRFQKVAPLKVAVPPLNSLSKAGEFNLMRSHHLFCKAGENCDKPDFIYQRLSLDNFAGMVMARRMQVPLVVEYNGSEVWVAENWGNGLAMPNTAKMAERVMLDHADLIVTVSDVLKQELLEKGVDENRVVMIPNGVDGERYHPARYGKADVNEIREKINASPSSVVVTFVGTFGPWHGAEIFARAIRFLMDHHLRELQDLNARFLFVGDGMCKADTEAAIGDDHLAPVTFSGLVLQSETPGYLQASDILVSPHVPNADGTAFFGSPTKLFEYMASGKAIVASDLEQVGTILEGSPAVTDLKNLAPDDKPGAGSAAVLCPPGDVKGLADAILFLLERRLWRQSLGENARKRVMQAYTWDHHVGIILDRITNHGKQECL